jgi:hypothetical protein
MMAELTNVSFAIFLDQNGANQPDAITCLSSNHFSHFIKLFKSDERKNSGIISVDGCK